MLTLPAADAAQSWIESRAAEGLARARELAASLRAGVEDPLRTWDDITLALGNVAAPASLLANVHPDEAVRAAAEQAEADVHRLSTELGQDREVYDALAAVSVAALDSLAVRLHEKTLRDFRRAGVDRDDATRARLTEINERLTQLDQDFSRAIRDDVRHVRVRPEQLDGMPADWVEAHPADAEGLVSISTDYPDSVPARMFVRDRAVREDLTTAFLERGWPQADAMLKEMFALRHELATLVGYPDWPSYDAEVKMIGSGPAIPEFIDRIATAAEEPMRRDLAVLLERLRADVPDAEALTAADSSFYIELVRKEQHGVDSQQVRTYFDFAKVRRGLLEVTGRLFGLRYEPVPDAVTWHEDVATYDVFEEGSTGSELIGRIHLDLFPREGKYKHAAQFTLVDGLAGRQLPEGVLVCNFSRGLMEHDHVVTLFHEFGHLLHHLIGGHGEWARFSGVATEWDFVEAPSQLLEEWAWDPAVLAGFATNAAGEPIPSDLVERMREAEDFGKGFYARQQMFYAAVSYWFHQERPDDLTARMAQLQERYAPTPWIPGTHFFASFGHLGGYSSAYYTYMWSLVIAKDMFSAFSPDDLFEPIIARRYRDRVLAPGGSKDAAALVTDFLGRESSFDAYAGWLAG